METILLDDFLDDGMYDMDCIQGHEGPSRTYKACWLPIEDFKNNKKTLYPLEILNYI